MRLLAALALCLLWGCHAGPTEPTVVTDTLTVEPYGTAAVRETAGTLDHLEAARAVRLGYARIAAGAEHPERVEAIRLDGLTIEVVSRVDRTNQPSGYFPDIDRAQIEPNLEALLEGCLMHRICDRIRNASTACRWS